MKPLASPRRVPAFTGAPHQADPQTLGHAFEDGARRRPPQPTGVCASSDMFFWHQEHSARRRAAAGGSADLGETLSGTRRPALSRPLPQIMIRRVFEVFLTSQARTSGTSVEPSRGSLVRRQHGHELLHDIVGDSTFTSSP